MATSRRIWLASALGGSAVAAGGLWAWSRRGRRRPPSKVLEEVSDGRRLVTSNGLPDHATGDYPNAHDPVPLRPQSLRFAMPERPEVADSPTPLAMWLFGVALNGVPFDPSGPFFNRDGTSGWQFEVMAPANAVALGIDANHAHTQGRGQYHYHGLPTGLLWSLRRLDPEKPMLLLGYAADGFPIYGPDAPSAADDLKSPTKRLISGYRLKSGRRINGPGGRFDGTFVEDFAYEPARGDLDECNGRVGPTPEYPDGTYYYVLTDEFPHIPRFYRGVPDTSFRHGPPPGVSPPVPGELMRYRGT